MARALTSAEIAELLDPSNTAASPAGARLAVLVEAHNAWVEQFGWDQTGNAQADQLPIPVRGITVTIPGPQQLVTRVIVFPDASGVLHFVEATDDQERSLADQVDKVTYASPDAGMLALLQDMVDRAEQLGKMLLIGGVLILAFLVVRELG